MLIKGTDSRGNAIPMSPAEALNAAVGRACKALNTLDTVYCADLRTVKLDADAVKSFSGADGIWEAWAEGVADIGYVNTKTGNFHHPVPHTFKLHYKLSKDEWGLPDIKMETLPVITPIERDPSKMAGPLPLAEPPQVMTEALERGLQNAKAEAKKRKENQEQKQ